MSTFQLWAHSEILLFFFHALTSRCKRKKVLAPSPTSHWVWGLPLSPSDEAKYGLELLAPMLSAHDVVISPHPLPLFPHLFPI